MKGKTENYGYGNNKRNVQKKWELMGKSILSDRKLLRV